MNLVAQIRKCLTKRFTLDVIFSVPAGVTILFGASGAGKTSLVRCLAGLVRPDSGRIAIGEHLLFDSDKSIDVHPAERNVGFVFQNLVLFPHMSVEENVQFGLGKQDAAAKRGRTQEILESFRIIHLLNEMPGKISGGERQRVALARSLVTDPQLLLLDEPLVALDYPTQSRIIEDLRVWNAARGIPILYVTHSHREVFALGERVVVLEEGRISAEGTPQEVLAMPGSEIMAQLAGFENFFDAVVTAVHAALGTMSCRLASSAVELEVPLARSAPNSAIRIAIRAGDILLASERPSGLSARNILPGEITSLKQQGALVIAEVDAGGRFEVHLTVGSCDALKLKVASAVWLVIKTYSCHIVSA